MRPLILLLTACCLFACTVQQSSYTQPLALQKPAPPVYADLDHWAAHPRKWDPSDSVPAPLRKEPRDTLADVFFIHPTTFTEKDAGGNADIDNAQLNQKTDETTILFQASAFNQLARVYAPRYRQAHLSSFYTDRAAAAPLFDTAYTDVKAAFLYYLQHENGGRPIVIAAHSQGAFLASKLLQEFFDGNPLQQQLVAAYVVGWPVTENQFRQLRACTTPGQNGCFVSWRTYKEGYIPEYILQEAPEAVVTNPLTWRSDKLKGDFQLNEGSILRNFNKIITKGADARVANGVLWVSKLKFPGAFMVNTSNYHIGDINLFYVNIRRNVAERIRAFAVATNGMP